MISDEIKMFKDAFASLLNKGMGKIDAKNEWRWVRGSREKGNQ